MTMMVQSQLGNRGPVPFSGEAASAASAPSSDSEPEAESVPLEPPDMEVSVHDAPDSDPESACSDNDSESACSDFKLEEFDVSALLQDVHVSVAAAEQHDLETPVYLDRPDLRPKPVPEHLYSYIAYPPPPQPRRRPANADYAPFLSRTDVSLILLLSTFGIPRVQWDCNRQVVKVRCPCLN
jgi:hypothetical protein